MPRPLGLPPLRILAWALVAVYIAANFILLVHWIPWAIRHGPWDFYVYRMASFRLFDGTMYDWGAGYIYPYSPVFAWLFAPIGSLGIWVWRALHVAVLAFIPSWPLRIVIVGSWPFWMDLWEGNVGLFFVLAGYWAVRGNRWGSWSFLALVVMIPKPYYLPALAWLLWRQPENRMRLAIVFVVHTVAALATGYAFDWIQALPGSSHDMSSPFNFMPSKIIGWWWWPIGLMLSALLVWWNHPGWASFTGVLYGGTHLPFMLPMEPDYQLRRLGRFLFPSRAAGPAVGSSPKR